MLKAGYQKSSMSALNHLDLGHVESSTISSSCSSSTVLHSDSKKNRCQTLVHILTRYWPTFSLGLVGSLQ